MAKRLTDTDKWKDEWFYLLPADMKLAWMYMIDNCDHAGIWKRNFELLRNSCGTVTKQLDAEKHMEGRFLQLPNGDWFFPKFLKFQYSKGIGGHAPAILSVRKKIIELGLLEYLAKQFGNSFVTVKDKDKDKDKDNKDLKNKKGDEEFFEDYIPPPEEEYAPVGAIIPDMAAIFLEHVPEYCHDRSLDYEPLGKIITFIKKQEGIKADVTTDRVAADKIKSSWRILCHTISEDSFHRSQSLKTLASHIQAVAQKAKGIGAQPIQRQNGTSKLEQNLSELEKAVQLNNQDHGRQQAHQN